MEADQDLHIAKHVEPENLPAMIQPIMSLAQSDAEHEPITRNRAYNNSCIACPQLSVLLTGTFSQYKALVPSIENGYFSRLLTLIVNDQQAFSSRYVEPASGSNGVVTTAARQRYNNNQKYPHYFFISSIRYSIRILLSGGGEPG